MSSNPNLASCQLQLRSPGPVCFPPIPHNANSAHVDDTLYVRGARIQHDGIHSVMRLDLSQIAESQLVGIMESRWHVGARFHPTNPSPHPPEQPRTECSSGNKPTRGLREQNHLKEGLSPEDRRPHPGSSEDTIMWSVSLLGSRQLRLCL